METKSAFNQILSKRKKEQEKIMNLINELMK